jgi:hypothetical protein
VKVHELKIWPESYEAIVRRVKTAEFRSDDRGFAAGDFLTLEEWEPTGEGVGDYTGRAATVFVTHVERGFGIPEGYAMLSFELRSAIE